MEQLKRITNLRLVNWCFMLNANAAFRFHFTTRSCLLSMFVFHPHIHCVGLTRSSIDTAPSMPIYFYNNHWWQLATRVPKHTVQCGIAPCGYRTTMAHRLAQQHLWWFCPNVWFDLISCVLLRDPPEGMSEPCTCPCPLWMASVGLWLFK